VKLDHLHLTGFLGWLFWGIVHVYFLIGVRNRFVVAFSWLWNYLTYQRGARLIRGDSQLLPEAADPTSIRDSVQPNPT
jgi:NADH dehydrogenase